MTQALSSRTEVIDPPISRERRGRSERGRKLTDEQARAEDRGGRILQLHVAGGRVAMPNPSALRAHSSAS